MCFYTNENTSVSWARKLCTLAGLSSCLDHRDMVKWFPKRDCSTSLYNRRGRRQGRAAALCESALSSSWGWWNNQVRVNGNGKQRRPVVSVPGFLIRKSKWKVPSAERWEPRVVRPLFLFSAFFTPVSASGTAQQGMHHPEDPWRAQLAAS